VIDILRMGDGNASARAWANACVMSGGCVRACIYGVNPRFLLAVARAKMAKGKASAADLRKLGVNAFRTTSRDVTHLSRMQLDDTLLERLGQKPDTSASLGSKSASPD
jgi:heterodisulfide reductase subunit D